MSYQQWAVGFYLFATGLKGTSSRKLRRDLGLGKGHVGHGASNSQGLNSNPHLFDGPVELDESFSAVGRKTSNPASGSEAGRELSFS